MKKKTPATPSSHAVRTVQRRQAGATESERDDLAVEEPLEIRVEGRAVAVTMRTPGHDEELAAGFLLTEGVVARRQDIISIKPAVAKRGGGNEANILDVRLARPETVDFSRLTRHVFTASSCGLCGKATIAAVQAKHLPLGPDHGPRVRTEVLAGMPATLRAAQVTFQRTGGLHATGLFDVNGALLALREDVGRHNAVDKIVGHALLEGKIDPAHAVLLVSGRVAFEIVQKALSARIAFVAAISAPTSLAVDFARAGGVTLVGFLRDGRMNVYAGADRIAD
ncbi:MAG TPA: formate dehydrogenase accessory sulfurtransferase FdhD [Lacunisphaera sp.]|nr:formate dehydrogenase accessory sulfurtransferase FdhD [Lacunisphaera sp.]